MIPAPLDPDAVARRLTECCDAARGLLDLASLEADWLVGLPAGVWELFDGPVLLVRLPLVPDASDLHRLLEALGWIDSLERIELHYPTSDPYVHFGEWPATRGKAVVATLVGDPPNGKGAIIAPPRIDVVDMTGGEYEMYRGGMGDW